MTAHPNSCPACIVNPRRRGQLLCRECWFRVPRPLRQAVNATWRAYESAQTWDDRRSKFSAYRQNAEEATRIAHESLPKPK
jgi:hypothetical protein